MGWRIRLLVIAALIGCVAVALLARWLASQPEIDATWHADSDGGIVLTASKRPLLKPHVGETLTSIDDGKSGAVRVDALLLRPSSRWLIHDADRLAFTEMRGQVFRAVSGGQVLLRFANGGQTVVQPEPHGFTSLGLMFWLSTGLALVVYLVAMVVLLARPYARNVLYAVMAICQTGNLTFIAIESTMQLAMPLTVTQWDMPLRLSLDLITAAACWHAAALHPRRVPQASYIAWAAWLVTALMIALLMGETLANTWSWLQVTIMAFAGAIVATSSWSHRLEPHPMALALRRFGILAGATWALLSLSLWAANDAPLLQQRIAAVGPAMWCVFFASLLLLLPFLSRSRQVMREFLLLAAVSTIATSLDLLFVSTFSLGEFTSLGLAMFLSLGIYSGARQWVLDQFRHRNMMATERTFEKLYQIAREIEAHPDRTQALVTQLLRELFAPLEATVVHESAGATRATSGGSTLVVALPDTTGGLSVSSVVMRYAHYGRRLFTDEDVRLANRVLDQLRRVVAFDKAVEQGRNEERLRLAQDLHDDIGARLLTLMYTANSPETEDYVRHTLQDLKTLTRGLAATSHTLLNAAAEWKTDLTHRLTAANMALGWTVAADRDIPLTVVQWSALTRVLRELVSNVIAHSHARRVDITLQLAGEALELTVVDNGAGAAPHSWAHGLGLGGVRKRVKQLGGEVEWGEAQDGGICCRMVAPRFADSSLP